jgi:hypothetical protein
MCAKRHIMFYWGVQLTRCLSVIHTQNPTRVVGSGYIQFAPQRPFQQPIQVQPPSVVVRTRTYNPLTFLRFRHDACDTSIALVGFPTAESQVHSEGGFERDKPSEAWIFAA